MGNSRSKRLGSVKKSQDQFDDNTECKILNETNTKKQFLCYDLFHRSLAFYLLHPYFVSSIRRSKRGWLWPLGSVTSKFNITIPARQCGFPCLPLRSQNHDPENASPIPENFRTPFSTSSGSIRSWTQTYPTMPRVRLSSSVMLSSQNLQLIRLDA